MRPKEAAAHQVSTIGPDQLAQLLGIARKTVIDSYTRQEGFPGPITSRKKPVWLESEVLKFLKRKSAQNANKASEAA